MTMHSSNMMSTATRIGALRRASTPILVVLLLFGFGCSQKNEFVQPPPPTVTVAGPVVRDVTRFANFTGKTGAVASVEIRARVQGWLEKQHFVDGQVVDKGDLLFTIDPRQYQAAVHQAEADLLNANTALAFAENDLARREKAFAENAISELDLLRSRADRDRAKATVAAAQARLEEAQINLGYCEIRSPITGKTSRRLVDVGNLVGADGATLLTTVTQIRPIYAYFNVNERDVSRYLRVRSDFRSENPEKNGTVRDMKAEVQLGIATEDDFPHIGTIDFIDNQVDPETGTMQARAVFPNTDITLLPGMFSKIRIPSEVLSGALLIPEIATAQDQQGHYALVVNSSNVVERRSIELGPKEGELIVILDGLEASDRVVINGLLNARPGSEVTPEVGEITTSIPDQTPPPTESEDPTTENDTTAEPAD